VIENAWSQSESEPTPGEAERIYQEMKLIAMSFWSWEKGMGDFIYSIRDGRIQVVFKKGMVIDDVMVYFRN
jgi:hypothetical protein